MQRSLTSKAYHSLRQIVARRNFANKASAPLPSECLIIDGARIPFTTGNSTYKDYMAYDLARLALKGLIGRNNINPSTLDGVIFGTVIQEVRTSNIAREAALGANIPVTVPAYTVSQACISANQAICNGAEKILSGKGDAFICGGVETFSDVPIRFSRPIRKKLLVINKAMKKGTAAVLSLLLKGLKLSHLAPEPPAIKNFSTDEVMGHSSDRLAARFGITRQAQDAFAAKSHQNAAKAHAAGLYKKELIPVQGSVEENGIRGDSTEESLSKLKAAFIKPSGTHTAANSSFLTDGAAAVLLASPRYAEEHKLKAMSKLKDFLFVAVDPFESMLLGPATAVEQLLARNGLKTEDIDVWEIHEAFAGQVLANIAELDKKGLNMSAQMDKVNTWGGSLSIGHPFGATGARLVTTASNRLIHENKKLAVVAACADGGLAHACLIEKA